MTNLVEPKLVDVDAMGRKSHLAFYNQFNWPWLDVCGRVDVTDVLTQSRASGCSVFAACMYHVIKTINTIPELRMRHTPEGTIVDVLRCSPSFTVKGPQGIFNFANVSWCEDLSLFAEAVTQANVDVGSDLNLSADHRLDLVFVTCLPWVDFTSIQHPRRLDGSPDSIPRIAWGKITTSNGRSTMPLSISAHHGLVDGAHLGAFFEKFGT